MHGVAEGEVNGEPGEHVGRMGGWVNAQMHVAVERRVKVPREAVHRGGWGALWRLECELHVSRVVNDVGPVGVLEGEALLGRGQHRNLVHLHNIRCLEALRLAVLRHAAVQLAGADRRHVRGVRLRDGHSILFQVGLSTIQALGRELVVAEGAQQLAHEHVRLLLRLKVTHVARHDGHLVLPAEGMVHALQRDERVGVLLHCQNAHAARCRLRGAQRGLH
mmetsp:Transcript_10003/g.36543  ORF Transcript_10003/g.36543 Transcript_10003/m.36543 type:complete len:220 (+) Transcript_10003:2049-2708(+)